MKTILIALLLAVSTAAFANNGEGTPRFCERHGCGLPENQECVPGVQQPTECPSPCPTPTCVCECPAAPACTPEVLVPCRRNNDGTMTCPRKKSPRRVLVPESIVETY